MRVFGAFLCVLIAAAAVAQPAARRITTVDALRQYPGYYHLQPVLLRGELVDSGERAMLRSQQHELRLMLGDLRAIDGAVEVRGQLLDIGKLEPGDPRLSGYQRREDERWPRPGEELVLRVSSLSPAPATPTPSVRALALEPWRFEGQPVTVVGQFRGRNLFGDLPDAPGTSRYDFVLRVADAAIWVTGLRPRGRGFDLNVDARVDTGRWLEVTGVVAHEGGLVAIDASRITTTTEPELTPDPEPPVVMAPPAPVEVVFSAPTEGEIDVARDSSVRIQFSRSIDPETLEGRLRIRYLGAESFERGEAQPPGIEVKTTYDPGTRALEVVFPNGLERFRTVRVELLEGVRAFDGAPVVPWTLMFSVGG